MVNLSYLVRLMTSVYKKYLKGREGYPLYPGDGIPNTYLKYNLGMNGRTKKKLWCKVVLHNHPHDTALNFFDDDGKISESKCQACGAIGKYKWKLGAEVWELITHEPAETYYLFCTECCIQQLGRSIYM